MIKALLLMSTQTGRRGQVVCVARIHSDSESDFISIKLGFAQYLACDTCKSRNWQVAEFCVENSLKK